MLEIGATLREARERRHLTQAEVEAATMIPARYLQALEREEFDRLPEGLYRRSFLREYAEYLGLNGDLYVVEYDLRIAPPPPPPEPPPARRTVWDAAAAVPLRALGIGACVVLVAAGLWWLGGRSGTSKPTGATLPVAAPPRRTTPPPKTVQPVVHQKPPALTLVAASGDCWLSVRTGSAAGPLVYQGTLRQGAKVVFGLRRRLAIRMGAPEHLTAKIGRRSITATLPGQTADVVVTARGLSTL
ncbi:MAG TPA: RodZ domain-containing protein [Gaiellaceae bacterium]|jgi:transcriptional regulator with XRE-family HTH domain|nr:RodZ domain-containing protein [Gaiellaceae bacterium]